MVEAGPSSPAVDQVEGAGLEPCYEPLHDCGNFVHNIMSYIHVYELLWYQLLW